MILITAHGLLWINGAAVNNYYDTMITLDYTELIKSKTHVTTDVCIVRQTAWMYEIWDDNSSGTLLKTILLFSREHENQILDAFIVKNDIIPVCDLVAIMVDLSEIRRLRALLNYG